MLYIFHGPDIMTGLEKSRALIDSLRQKKPDAAFVRIEADDWNSSIIKEHAGGQGLFSNKYIVFLDRLTENAEAKELLAELAPVMQESANIFIVLESKLTAELKKSFEKYADKMIECEKQETGSKKRGENNGKARKEDFNIFALTGAMVGGDPVKAWKIYREAMDMGTPPENILGVLFWKAKSISSNKLARDIVVLYHEGHRGTVDLELGIERLLLAWN